MLGKVKYISVAILAEKLFGVPGEGWEGGTFNLNWMGSKLCEEFDRLKKNK